MKSFRGDIRVHDRKRVKKLIKIMTNPNGIQFIHCFFFSTTKTHPAMVIIVQFPLIDSIVHYNIIILNNFKYFYFLLLLPQYNANGYAQPRVASFVNINSLIVL